MGDINFNFPTNFPQNGVLQPQLLHFWIKIFGQDFLTAQNLGVGAIASYQDATDDNSGGGSGGGGGGSGSGGGGSSNSSSSSSIRSSSIVAVAVIITTIEAAVL